jgi:hypothetical protein
MKKQGPYNMNQENTPAVRGTQRDWVLEQLADLLAQNDITPPSSLHAIALCLLENHVEISNILQQCQSVTENTNIT